MKRSSTYAGIGGAAGLMVIGAMLSPVLTTATAAGAEQAAAAPTHVVQSAPARTHTKSSHVSASEASDAVVAQVKGGRVVATHSAKHGGYKAFAVKVERTDGSTVIGYVDRASGVVFDWSQPTAPTSTPSTAPTSSPSSHSEGADDDSDDASEDLNDDNGSSRHDSSDDSQHDSSDDSHHDDDSDANED